MKRLGHGWLESEDPATCRRGALGRKSHGRWRSAARRTYICQRCPTRLPAPSRGPREPRSRRRVDPAHAQALARGEGAAPADHPVLSGRRLLRDVPRGRRGRGPGPRDHADLAGRRRAARRGAGEGRRRVSAPAGRRGHPRRHLRAGGGPQAGAGLVRREVVETVTPGAMLQEGWLAGAQEQLPGRARGRRGSRGARGDRSQHRRVRARDARPRRRRSKRWGGSARPRS